MTNVENLNNRLDLLIKEIETTEEKLKLITKCEKLGLPTVSGIEKEKIIKGLNSLKKEKLVTESELENFHKQKEYIFDPSNLVNSILNIVEKTFSKETKEKIKSKISSINLTTIFPKHVELSAEEKRLSDIELIRNLNNAVVDSLDYIEDIVMCLETYNEDIAILTEIRKYADADIDVKIVSLIDETIRGVMRRHGISNRMLRTESNNVWVKLEALIKLFNDVKKSAIEKLEYYIGNLERNKDKFNCHIFRIMNGVDKWRNTNESK